MTEAISPIEAIPVHKIEEDPTFQLRLQWDPATDTGLAGLAESLAGLEGLIHPVVVVRLAESTTFGRTYALVAGHRRLAAARRLGWPTIPGRVLPPCDLTAPLHRLHLLAIAVRENTEREDLPPADRRAALQRLQALHAEVYPEAVSSGRRSGAVGGEPRPLSFLRWATRATHLSERTIRRDLRGVLLGGTPPAAERPAAEDTIAMQPVPDISQAAQQAAMALQTLAADFTPDTRASLPDPQFAALHQHLEGLQAALARVWPVVRVQTEHPLVPFAWVAQEQLATLRGTLWGLRTGPPEAWATLPPTVARQMHTAMATLLACWQEVAPLLEARLHDASAA